MCCRGRQASLVTAITQDTLVKTQSLFRVCVVVLSSITSWSVAAAAASSLMRFSLGPSCRGDAATPWLESAFISHAGCVSRHLFACFRSTTIACVSFGVPPLLRVSVFSASSAARARSFCTHERTRTTKSTVFEHIHHKDRRQLQLIQRPALHGRASLAAVSSSRHISSTSFCAFVRSRRRPEKWTRTRKWDSRGSITVNFVCTCTLFGFFLTQGDGGG